MKLVEKCHIISPRRAKIVQNCFDFDFRIEAFHNQKSPIHAKVKTLNELTMSFDNKIIKEEIICKEIKRFLCLNQLYFGVKRQQTKLKLDNVLASQRKRRYRHIIQCSQLTYIGV